MITLKVLILVAFVFNTSLSYHCIIPMRHGKKIGEHFDNITISGRNLNFGHISEREGFCYYDDSDLFIKLNEEVFLEPCIKIFCRTDYSIVLFQ